jgi:hypothetical protein
MVEQYLSASADSVLTGNGSKRAEGLVRCLVNQFAVDVTTVALELARKSDDERHLFKSNKMSKTFLFSFSLTKFIFMTSNITNK